MLAHQPSPETLTTTLHDGHLRVRGELDLCAVTPLRRAATELLDGGRGDVVVDITQVSFLDAAGIRGLLELTRRAAAARRRLTILPAHETVMRPVAMLGLEVLLPLARPA